MKKLTAFLLCMVLCGSLITLASSANEIKNRISLDIPFLESDAMLEASDNKPRQGKDLLNGVLASEIERLNPNFATEYYTVRYDTDIQVVFLSKVIPTDYGNVLTGVNYMISVKDGIAYQLDYSEQPTAEMVQREKTISTRIRNFVWNGGEKRITLPNTPKTEVKVRNSYYGYQHEDDELFYVVEYDVIHLDEGGVISADEIVVQVPQEEKGLTGKILLSASVILVVVFVSMKVFAIKRRK